MTYLTTDGDEEVVLASGGVMWNASSLESKDETAFQWPFTNVQARKRKLDKARLLLGTLAPSLLKSQNVKSLTMRQLLEIAHRGSAAAPANVRDEFEEGRLFLAWQSEDDGLVLTCEPRNLITAKTMMTIQAHWRLKTPKGKAQLKKYGDTFQDQNCIYTAPSGFITDFYRHHIVSNQLAAGKIEQADIDGLALDDNCTFDESVVLNSNIKVARRCFNGHGVALAPLRLASMAIRFDEPPEFCDIDKDTMKIFTKPGARSKGSDAAAKVKAVKRSAPPAAAPAPIAKRAATPAAVSRMEQRRLNRLKREMDKAAEVAEQSAAVADNAALDAAAKSMVYFAADALATVQVADASEESKSSEPALTDDPWFAGMLEFEDFGHAPAPEPVPEPPKPVVVEPMQDIDDPFKATSERESALQNMFEEQYVHSVEPPPELHMAEPMIHIASLRMSSSVLNAEKDNSYTTPDDFYTFDRQDIHFPPALCNKVMQARPKTRLGNLRENQPVRFTHATSSQMPILTLRKAFVSPAMDATIKDGEMAPALFAVIEEIIAAMIKKDGRLLKEFDRDVPEDVFVFAARQFGYSQVDASTHYQSYLQVGN